MARGHLGRGQLWQRGDLLAILVSHLGLQPLKHIAMYNLDLAVVPLGLVGLGLGLGVGVGVGGGVGVGVGSGSGLGLGLGVGLASR